jgi:hypothetical protein
MAAAMLQTTQSGTLVKEIQMHDKSVTKLLVVSNKEVWSCALGNSVKVWSSEGEYLADARTQDQVYCLIEIPGPRGDTKVWSTATLTPDVPKPIPLRV